MFIIVILIMILAYYFFEEPEKFVKLGGVGAPTPPWYTLVHRSGTGNLSAFEFNNIASWLIEQKYVVTFESKVLRSQPEQHARHALYGVAKTLDPIGPNLSVTTDTTVYTLGSRQLRLSRFYTTICDPSYNVRFNTLELANDLLLASQTFAGCRPTTAVSYAAAQPVLDLLAKLPSLPKSHTFVPEEWIALPPLRWFACVKYNGVSCFLYKNLLIHGDSNTVCNWPHQVDGLIYGELMPDGTFYILDIFAIGTKNITNLRWSQRRANDSKFVGIRGGQYFDAPDLETGINAVTAFAAEHKIDSDGTVFVSDSVVKCTITKKWKHYTQLTVDVLVDFDTGDLYSRDRTSCVKIDAPTPVNLAEMRPPGTRLGVVECLVYPIWQITRLRTDKARPNAIITVQSIIDLARLKIDVQWTKTKIEKLRPSTSTTLLTSKAG